MAFDINSLNTLGLPEMVLWLLSFAVIYGVLSQAKMPKSAASRLIISLVMAFFVLLAAPANVVQVLSVMSSNLILVVIALLILIVFLEVFGVKVKKSVPIVKDGKPLKDERGKIVMTEENYGLFEAYGYLFFFAFIVIAALIFVNSGGLGVLGLNINLSPYATTTTAFLIFILLAVVWMFAEKK